MWWIIGIMIYTIIGITTELFAEVLLSDNFFPRFLIAGSIGVFFPFVVFNLNLAKMMSKKSVIKSIHRNKEYLQGWIIGVVKSHRSIDESFIYDRIESTLENDSFGTGIYEWVSHYECHDYYKKHIIQPLIDKKMITVEYGFKCLSYKINKVYIRREKLKKINS
jgi:hypothetical protein